MDVMQFYSWNPDKEIQQILQTGWKGQLSTYERTPPRPMMLYTHIWDIQTWIRFSTSDNM